MHYLQELEAMGVASVKLEGRMKRAEYVATLTAGVSGRVKKIYAEVGDDVGLCMAENGALALLSLDGYLAVDVEAEGPARGDAVTVTLADGSQIAGVVEQARKGSLTVLVSDDGPLMDEEVTVSDASGKVRHLASQSDEATGTERNISRRHRNVNT